MRYALRLLRIVLRILLVGSIFLPWITTSCGSGATTPADVSPAQGQSAEQGPTGSSDTVTTEEHAVSATATATTHLESAPAQTVTSKPDPTATPAPTLAPSPTPLPEILTAPADPLSLTVALDDSHAVSATIPITGGSLGPEAADGTRFTLEVPEGALLSSATITLAPLRDIVDLPLSGGLAAGVHAEPEDLLFFKAATLTIELPADQPTEGIVGFGYHGSGQAFHLVPWTQEGHSVTLHLMHLSGYGAGRGTAEDLAQVGEQYTCSVAERMLSRIAEVMAGQGSMSPAMRQQIAGILRLWYAAVVQPEVEAAKGDDAAIHCAIYHFLEWYEQVSALGLDDEFPNAWGDFEQDVTELLEKAIDRASERCVSENDPHQAIRMLRWTQLIMMFGDPSRGHLEDVWPKVVACARFELEFDSDILYDHFGYYPTEHAHVFGEGIPVALDEGWACVEPLYGPVSRSEEPSRPGEFVFRGQGPVNHIEWEWPYECFVREAEYVGTLHVLRARIDLNVPPDEGCICNSQPPADEQPPDRELVMFINLTSPLMLGYNPCLDGSDNAHGFWVSWNSNRDWATRAMSFCGVEIEISGWEIMPRGDPLFAIKRFDQPIRTGGGHEVTTMKLWHVPRACE